MSSSTTSNSVTSAFIDLATYDEQEKYLYGGTGATTYFVKSIRKSTWFSVVPTCLTSQTKTWGSPFEATISRAGDYLLRVWVRVQLPELTFDFDASNPFGSACLPSTVSARYTRNLAHNLFNEIKITFNDLIESRMDSYFLDFWSAFTIPAGKKNGYNNMIGNYAELTNPQLIGAARNKLPAAILNLPLPFTHFRETGLSLPTAALPYNDMKIKFDLRKLNSLVIFDSSSLTTSVPCAEGYLNSVSGYTQNVNMDVWAEYAIVSNMERTQMGKAPRDILIEQVQTTQGNYNPSSVTSYATQHQINFAHAIKALMFAARNTSNSSEWSNYTAASPVVGTGGVVFSPTLSSDPISQTTLQYENTNRLCNLGSDYFSLIQPFYTAIDIPMETGYHLYSYSLDLTNSNPLGSTNYGKLTNVRLECWPSSDAVIAANVPAVGGSTASPTNPNTDGYNQWGAAYSQTFQLIVCGVNHNIVRIAGGALGFPVL
jgi:hypothetical protein